MQFANELTVSKQLLPISNVKTVVLTVEMKAVSERTAYSAKQDVFANIAVSSTFIYTNAKL